MPARQARLVTYGLVTRKTDRTSYSVMQSNRPPLPSDFPNWKLGDPLPHTYAQRGSTCEFCPMIVEGALEFLVLVAV